MRRSAHSDTPTRLLNAQQIREFDRIAIEDVGIPGVVLMENAGGGTARDLRARLAPQDRNKPIAIFAGPGNNGGDGYVIARHLQNAGHTVWTFWVKDPANLKGDARINYEILAQMTDAIFDASSADALAAYGHPLDQCSAIVDALLGTGLGRDVEGWLLALIQQLNDIQGPLKLAVDIPSGLDSDTGRPRPDCFRADVTTTYAFPKIGLHQPDARPFVGDIKTIGIGAPESLSDQTGWECELLAEGPLRAAWPGHRNNSHKGTYGHLLVVAGATGTVGAALMTSKASLRMGTGLCTLATHASAHDRIEGKVPEIMCLPLSDDPPGTKRLASLWEGKAAVAFGPGLGQGKAAEDWLVALLTTCEKPLVIDADGLNLLVHHLDRLASRDAPTILTPHPGEMSRLMGVSTQQIQGDRLNAAREFATRHGVLVVLKGAGTIIAAPDGESWLNPTGNAGLATGGSGDVLTGMIGALLARGCTPTYAAQAAVFLHGLAAERLAPQMGYSGIIATDIIQTLPGILASWESP